MSLENKDHFKKLRFSQAILWLSIVFLLLFGLALLLDVKPNDFWWYMRVARDALANGAIPQVDTLSFTHAGQPIVYHSWLSAMIFYLTYQAGGLPGIVILRVLSIAATLVIMWYLMYRTGLDPILTAGLLFLAGLATSNNWATIRPQMFIIPLFLLTLGILIRWEEKENRVLWFLPIISLFWVNLHGSFILLPLLALPALLFGKGDRKPLFFALTFAIIVFMFNPRGLGVWDYVWNTLTLSSNQGVSIEWSPPVNEGWQLNMFFAWLLLFTPLIAFSRGRLSRLDWVWFLGFGWMALSGIRYVIWFALFLAIWTARLIATLEIEPSKYVRFGHIKLNFVLASTFILLPAFLMPGFRDVWWKEAPPVLPDTTPTAAVEWLSEHPELQGELWSDLDFASYLTFVLPERPLWIDLRFEMIYSLNDWDEYRTVAAGDHGWDEILIRDNVNLIIVSYDNPSLLVVLQDSEDWCRGYKDDVAVIFSRRTTNDSCDYD